MSFVFNPNEVDTSDDFTLMPEGVYMLQATKVERTFKDSGDLMVKIIFSTMNDEYPGAFSQRFNLIHSSPQAQEIARKDFAKFCNVTGISQQFPAGFEMDEASDEEIADIFCHKPFDAKLGVEKSKDPKYSDANRIAKYFPVGEGGNYGPLKNPQASHAPAAPPANRPAAAPPANRAAAPAASAAPANSTAAAPRAAASAGSRPWNRAAS